MFYVKVSGETLGELKLGLEAKLAEIEGRTVKTPRSFAVTNASVNETEDDEMEEVESPYANNVASIDRSTVVDNELDSEGIPWDSRIHSGKKTKNKDGSWKLVKGVDKAIVPQVKAELKARVGSTPVVAPAYQAPVVEQPVYQAPVQAAPVVAPAQPTIPSAAAPIPQMQTGHTLDSFKNQFALILANLVTQGKLTQDYLNTLKNHFGVPEIWMASDEQKAACFNEFVNCGLVQKVG